MRFSELVFGSVGSYYAMAPSLRFGDSRMTFHWEYLADLPVIPAILLASVALGLLIREAVVSRSRKQRRLRRKARHRRIEREWNVTMWVRKVFGLPIVRRLTDQREDK
jgi:hypothetical protein